jgi:TRAP transporter TAXI family solute receptor
VLLACLVVGCTGTAPSQPASTKVELPKIIALTTRGVGTSHYNISVAIRDTVEKNTTMKLRLEAFDSDKARMTPLKNKESEFVLNSAVQTYYVRNATDEFAEWGPTPLQRVWTGFPNLTALMARGNAGFKTIADLKGKRVPQTPASAAFSLNHPACLAFGGLTLKDVTVVTTASIPASQKGVIEGTIDACNNAYWSATAQELASSPHGIKWFDMPASDKDGWARVVKVTPWAAPVADNAAGLKQGEKVTGLGYEQGIYAYPWTSDDVVYAFCKAMKEGNEAMMKMGPDPAQWTWAQAISLEGLMNCPYHNGTVKYLKDIGAWTPAHEQYQKQQLELEKQIKFK